MYLCVCVCVCVCVYMYRYMYMHVYTYTYIVHTHKHTHTHTYHHTDRSARWLTSAFETSEPQNLVRQKVSLYDSRSLCVTVGLF